MEHFKMFTKKDGMIFLLLSKFGSDGYVVYYETVRMLAEGNYFFKPLTINLAFLAHELVSVSQERVIEVYRWLVTQKSADGTPKLILTEDTESGQISILIPKLEELNREFARKNADILRDQKVASDRIHEPRKPVPGYDPEADMNVWNEIKFDEKGKNITWRTAIKKLSDDRRSKLKVRHGVDPDFNMPALMAAADASGHFLKTGKWFTFDWIIKNDTNWRKLLEGNYRDNENPTGEKTKPEFMGKVVE
jgi:hypothetical protein